MKSTKASRDDRFLNEIVATLKAMPTRRLRLVRDFVGALAAAGAAKKSEAGKKKFAVKSLLNTPFCGMWEGRSDIANGRSYADSLRQKVEHRGDRT